MTTAQRVQVHGFYERRRRLLTSSWQVPSTTRVTTTSATQQTLHSQSPISIAYNVLHLRFHSMLAYRGGLRPVTLVPETGDFVSGNRRLCCRFRQRNRLFPDTKSPVSGTRLVWIGLKEGVGTLTLPGCPTQGGSIAAKQ